LILQALIQSKDHKMYRHILDATHAILFFGAPHQGLRTTELEAMVDEISSDSGGGDVQARKLLQQLSEGSDFLEGQSDRLVDVLSGLQVVSYYETVPTRTVNKTDTGEYKRNGELFELVKRVSSQLNLPSEHRIPVPYNHTDMVKFLAPSDLIYRSVATHIKNYIESLLDRQNERQDQSLEPEEPPNRWSNSSVSTGVNSKSEGVYVIHNGSVFSGTNNSNGGRIFQGDVNTGGGSFSFG